ncbi:MAG: hypothetical protein JXA14_21835 [Anaerolineae bacterium]|nr:hypothetical protein [Anaerolineae bacterium]
MAVECYFPGTIEDYPKQFVAWVVGVRPKRCPHCHREDCCIFWGCYLRWVYTTTDKVQIWIMRVRCTVCKVTDALLPSFLHMYRRYTLLLIQQALYLVLDAGLWGIALVKAVAPYGQPAPSTLCEWVSAFVDSAQAWLVDWLQRALTALDPLALPNPGRLSEHIRAIPSTPRRDKLSAGWQALRLTEALYALTRARQPDLAFRAEVLLAFLAAALGSAGRIPRILWPQAAARAP